MKRWVGILSILALFCIGFGPVARAFDVPGMGDGDSSSKKKKKKKNDDSSNSDSNSTKDSSSGNSDTAASKDSGTKDSSTKDSGTKKDSADDSSASKEMQTQVHDSTMPLKMWDEWYKNAKVGDFVVYTTKVGAKENDTKMRQEVVEVGDHYVAIVYTTMMDKFKNSMRHNLHFKDPEVKEGAETVKVGDKDVATKRTEVLENGKTQTTTWTSTEVPLGGVVKTETGDGATKVQQVLIEFGRGK